MTKEAVRDAFVARFGRTPEVLAKAPGRINLIGEHVDYQQGLVMPAAVDRHVFAAAAPIAEPEVRLWSALSGGDPVTYKLKQLMPVKGEGDWVNYVIGVVDAYRSAGHSVGGFEVAFTSDLPAGAGLSSSAALESASAMVVEGLNGLALPPKERALLCQHAEHTYAGVPCGVMDQFASNAGAAGHALVLDCKSLDFELTAIPEGVAFAVVDCGVKHSLADGEYAKRRADCEAAAKLLGVKNLCDATPIQVQDAEEKLGDQLFRRARHVVTEIERVPEFAKVLSSGDLRQAGRLMNASHRSLRDDYEVSCPELNLLSDIAKASGAYGARMMGGGFGGSVVSLIDAEESVEFVARVVEMYSREQGVLVEGFPVKAVEGATWARVES